MAGKNKVGVVIVLAVLLIGVGAAAVYGFVYMKKSAMERAVETGVEAEKKGDTEQALAEYKKAAELCAPKDDRCRIDMEMKVKLMTDALNYEQSAKAGDPVEGAENIPTDKSVTPDDSGLNE